MKKFKKIIAYLLLVLIVVSCIPNLTHQEKYFQIHKTNENELSYQFEAYGLEQLNLKLVEYDKTERIDVIPLGQIVYNKTVYDKGRIDLNYVLSKYNNKVIKLNLNSKYFKNYGDTKIMDLEIDLSLYTKKILISQLQLKKSKEDIQLIEFLKTDNSKEKYCIEMDISLLQ